MCLLMGDIREAKEVKEIKEFEKFGCVRSLRKLGKLGKLEKLEKLEKNGHYDKNLKFSNLSKFLKFSNLPPPTQEGICCQKVANLVPIKRKSGWDILTYFPFALWIEVPK